MRAKNCIEFESDKAEVLNLSVELEKNPVTKKVTESFGVITIKVPSSDFSHFDICDEKPSSLSVKGKFN